MSQSSTHSMDDDESENTLSSLGKIFKDVPTACRYPVNALPTSPTVMLTRACKSCQCTSSFPTRYPEFRGGRGAYSRAMLNLCYKQWPAHLSPNCTAHIVGPPSPSTQKLEFTANTCYTLIVMRLKSPKTLARSGTLGAGAAHGGGTVRKVMFGLKRSSCRDL